MKKVLVFAVCSILSVGAAVLASPVIAVDVDVFNFGEVLEGIAVVHTFVLSNIGDETLLITDVQVTCGCTTTALEKPELAPGESVDLEVTLDTAGFSDTIAKSIRISSNDPATPLLTLLITGSLKTPQRYHIPASDLNYLFYLLIDLRVPEAYAKAHLYGAINIPFAELNLWIDRLPRGIFIVLYDQGGSDADLAAQALIENGFPEARSLLGGFNEWSRQFKDKFVLTLREEE